MVECNNGSIEFEIVVEPRWSVFRSMCVILKLVKKYGNYDIKRFCTPSYSLAAYSFYVNAKNVIFPTPPSSLLRHIIYERSPKGYYSFKSDGIN